MDGHFAEEENLETCIAYLNQALLAHGVSTSLAPGTAIEKGPMVKACNCIYRLLQLHQENTAAREGMNEQRQKLLIHMRNMESTINKLTNQIEMKERELQAMVSKERKAAAALKEQVERLQQERDEFHRLGTAAQQLSLQQSHELKKKEKDFQRLQERLAALVAEKREGKAKAGIDISALLIKEGRQRATWDGKKVEDDLYKELVNSFETKYQAVLSENGEFRERLFSIQRQLQHIVQLVESNVCDQRESSALGHDLTEGFFALPLESSRVCLANSIDEKLETIKAKLLQRPEPGGQPPVPVGEDGDVQLLHWQRQAAIAQHLCAEKDDVLQMLLLQTPTPSRLEERASTSAEEWALLDEERRRVAMEKSALQRRAAHLDALQDELESGRQENAVLHLRRPDESVAG